jgi:hypothetical protein
MALHPSRPNTLFMQKHWDVMRSDDAGDSWNEVSGNLPPISVSVDVHAQAGTLRFESKRFRHYP